jgi:signal transduction histidine kinase
MRLTTKGLLLIAIPALFELAILAGLVKAQSEVAQAERWNLHGEDVLRGSAAVLEPVLLDSVRLRGAILRGDDDVQEPVALWTDLDRRIDRLSDLVADNPAQVERVEQVREAVQGYRQWSDRMQDLLNAGHRIEVLARVNELARADALDAVRAEITAFQADERRLDAQRAAEADAARTRQQLLVGAAVLGSLVFIALAVWLFTRGVRGRLVRLADNTGRLAGNELLAPVDAGSDEIGQLGAALQETSRRLLEAERLQARYQSDLARRADELVRINETLRQQTQENEMFIYSVSHDLRAPLVNLQGFSNELRHACDDLRGVLRDSPLAPAPRGTIERLVDEDIGEALHFLQTAVLRASHIIDALLRLSRVGRVEYRRQPVGVGALVQRVVDAMQASIRARNARVTVHPLPPVWGDPTSLEQVFANLLGNAVNYLDPRREGRIEIGTTAAPPGVQSLHIFYVADNGLGIPAVAMPRLFSAFQRLHGQVAAGEGIGLALVRRVIERHGGRIWAESSEGVGTTFYFSLPQAPARETRESADALVDDAPGFGTR